MFYSESKECWIERVKLPTGKTKEITAKTENALAKKLVAYNKECEKGKTFSAYADAWEESRDGKIEDKTAQSYSAHIKRAKDYFEGRYIADITPDEVQSYVDYLVELDFAKDTVRRGLVVVNKIFKYAITSPGSGLRFNPCAAVEIPRGLRQTQREPPTEAQIAKVVPDSPMGLFAFFLLCTGLRPGELLALQWDDIDREAKTISISKVATYPTDYPVVKNRTKTAAGMRTVPLLDVLDAALPKKKGKSYIFGNGETPYDKQTFYREWAEWCLSVGLGEEIIYEHTNEHTKHKYRKRTVKAFVTPYQFRHEFASVLEDEGVSEFDAQHIMGHSSITITKDKYTKFREKKNKNLDARNKLNQRMSGKKVEDG